MIMTFDTEQDKQKFEEAYRRYNKVCYNFALDILMIRNLLKMLYMMHF